MKINNVVGWVLLSAALFTLAACASTNIIAGTWNLISAGPQNNPIAVVPDSNSSLTIGQDGKISGSVGCNTLSGNLSISSDQITFGPIASTLMACADPVMVQEGYVLNILTGTAKFTLENNTLTIINGENIAVFEKEAK
ncbi:MAG: META domain-containing protein [Chloroflexota bacterium]